MDLQKLQDIFGINIYSLAEPQNTTVTLLILYPKIDGFWSEGAAHIDWIPPFWKFLEVAQRTVRG